MVASVRSISVSIFIFLIQLFRERWLIFLTTNILQELNVALLIFPQKAMKRICNFLDCESTVTMRKLHNHEGEVNLTFTKHLM